MELAARCTEGELEGGLCRLTADMRHKYCDGVGVHIKLTMGGTTDNRCAGVRV